MLAFRVLESPRDVPWRARLLVRELRNRESAIARLGNWMIPCASESCRQRVHVRIPTREKVSVRALVRANERCRLDENVQVRSRVRVRESASCRPREHVRVPFRAGGRDH